MNTSPQSTSVAQISTPQEEISQLKEAISQHQAALLRREKFAAVLGSETIDLWQVDWIVLENLDIPFSDSRKASLMSQLNMKLFDICKMPDRTDTFNRLHYDFLVLRAKISIMQRALLDNCARQYFAQRFPSSTVQFDLKLTGVQMGCLARVALPTGELLTYHIKTHSSGRRESKSGCADAKPVDPRELLVYKALEHLGIGCETHLLHQSLEDFYIATLDAGHEEGSSFSTFRRATGCRTTSGDALYGESLWGSLSQLKYSKESRAMEVNDGIAQDAIAQNFMLQMTSLNLISRIFRLRDLLDNADNYGFCTSAAGQPLLKALDFRLSQDFNMSLYHDHFGGFLVGSGLFNYIGLHISLRYALCDRPQVERVEAARHLLTSGSLCKLHDCIQRAHDDVRLYFESSVFSDSDVGKVPRLLVALEEYCQVLHRNVDFFTSSFKSWSAPAGLPL